MSRNPLDKTLRDAVVGWTEDAGSPVLDLAAIRRRAFRLQYPAASRPSLKLQAAIAISVTLALLAAAPSFPAIVSNVSRAFHAFAIGDGRVQTARTRTVTLEQARKDMPFTVLTPAGLPPSLHANINEVYPSGKRAEAQLWFDFSAEEPGKPVTIIEMSASSRYAALTSELPPARHNGEVVVTQTQTGKHLSTGAIAIGAPSTCVSIKFSRSGTPFVRTACEPPVGGPGHVIVSAKGKRGATLSTFNGKGKALQQPFRPPVRFVAHGTLVVLLDPAGALSRQQVDALRAAMSQ
jgi:hypothetical protein